MNRKTEKKVVKRRILSNKKVAEDHYVMKIEAPRIARDFSPGQFVAVKAREKVTDPLIRIPLGIHRTRGKGLELLYKVVGPGTALLSAKKTGEKIDMLGPLGNGFDLSPLTAAGKKTAVIVAGGHGIAPLYPLAEITAKKAERTEFFIGTDTKDHVVRAEELKKLGIRVHIATEDGSRGFKGYVTELLKKQLKRTTKHETRTTLYACGPRPMLAALAEIAGEMKISGQVSLDAYMACGIGACLGCAIRTVDGYKLVCKDGPVFDVHEIDWKRALRE
ncbi:MAG: dihydroorotate dehydrogenase electron transfer subunit [Candidatus Omnitrophota bacterium]|nr:dihydroorotate dehydrogenase electron transfer subunit [Candidatus Omnitrophota bacterium]